MKGENMLMNVVYELRYTTNSHLLPNWNGSSMKIKPHSKD